MAPRPGSATRARHGKRARSRTPTAGCGAICYAAPISSASASAACARSVTSSTTRRANAWIIARRSITFDHGTEFTDWPYLQAGIGAQTWFCDPQSPWQKGTVENTNGRAKKWLSRDVDPLSLTDRDLKDICERLNTAPRKCLGYKTPAEVFQQRLLAQMRAVG